MSVGAMFAQGQPYLLLCVNRGEDGLGGVSCGMIDVNCSESIHGENVSLNGQIVEIRSIRSKSNVTYPQEQVFPITTT